MASDCDPCASLQYLILMRLNKVEKNCGFQKLHAHVEKSMGVGGIWSITKPCCNIGF